MKTAKWRAMEARRALFATGLFVNVADSDTAAVLEPHFAEAMADARRAALEEAIAAVRAVPPLGEDLGIDEAVKRIRALPGDAGCGHIKGWHSETALSAEDWNKKMATEPPTCPVCDKAKP